MEETLQDTVTPLRLDKVIDFRGFDNPSEKTDVVFVIEDHKLHLNKVILSFASPIFDKMLYGDFKEKSQTEINLPGKKCEDFIAFLLCIYPNTMEEVRSDNVEIILPLAVEYQVQQLINKCEPLLIKMGLDDRWISVGVGRRSGKRLVHSIVLAERYSLSTMFEQAVALAVNRRFSDLKNEPEFAAMSEKTKTEILLKRMHLLETSGLQVSSVIAELLDAISVEPTCTHVCQVSVLPTNTGTSVFGSTIGYNESLKSTNVISKLNKVASHRCELQTFFHVLGLKQKKWKFHFLCRSSFRPKTIQ